MTKYQPKKGFFKRKHVFRYICLSIGLSNCSIPPFFISVSLSLGLSPSLPSCLPLSLSIYLSISLSQSLPVSLCIYLYFTLCLSDLSLSLFLSLYKYKYIYVYIYMCVYIYIYIYIYIKRERERERDRYVYRYLSASLFVSSLLSLFFVSFFFSLHLPISRSLFLLISLPLFLSHYKVNTVVQTTFGSERQTNRFALKYTMFISLCSCIKRN